MNRNVLFFARIESLFVVPFSCSMPPILIICLSLWHFALTVDSICKVKFQWLFHLIFGQTDCTIHIVYRLLIRLLKWYIALTVCVQDDLCVSRSFEFGRGRCCECGAKGNSKRMHTFEWNAVQVTCLVDICMQKVCAI